MGSIRSRKSVYVIEDDIGMSSIIDRILKNIDPDIILDWTASAEDAKKKIQTLKKKGVKKPYDMIISDVLLDGSQSGIDFWHYCKNEYQDIPIVLTSACNSDSLLKENIHLPEAAIFLQKPFSIAESRELFKSTLNLNEQKREMKSTPTM